MPPSTASERQLADLCGRSFHSLWSFPTPWREGRELCDLLVLFEHTAIVFSIKECSFLDSAPVELAWNRWVRECVFSSADQALGAGKALRNPLVPIYVDALRKSTLPIRQEDRPSLRIIYVLAALGARKACEATLSSSGSLRLRFAATRSHHVYEFDREGKLRAPLDSSRLFTIGRVGRAGEYVHVLDDVSLGLVLQTLDTVQDFIGYLERKERAIESGQLVGADGEEHILAYYLQHGTPDRGHDFVFRDTVSAFYLGPRWWPEFAASAHRQAQIKADEQSYIWDRLIERAAQSFTRSSGGRLSYPARERAVTLLGRENRLHRRGLAEAYDEFARGAGRRHFGIKRLIPTVPGDPLYVFVMTPTAESDPDPVHTRRRILDLVCRALSRRMPEFPEIVGIAPSYETPEEPEDIMYLNSGRFTAEDWKAAEEAQRLIDTLGPLTPSAGIIRMQEFPGHAETDS